MRNLNNFFSPKSIAIVGASPKKGKLGNVLIENIRKGGWQGKLFFVNPKYTKSQRGYFSSLNEISKPVDLVLIAIPAPLVNETIEAGAKSKPAIKNFVVISSGFKELGTKGQILEENLKKLARKYNLNVLGPNCLGFADPQEKLNATFTDVKLQKGNIAIVSQSGALAVALLDWAANKKIGFSKIISIGNKTILDESEIINFLAKDKGTKSLALYLEDVKSGQKFMSALARITPHKPVIILKAGKTAAGQKAISSHTGSLAQDEEIIRAVFEKMNAIPVNNIEEFQDIIYYLDSNPVPTKNEVIILTNAGGPGVMASDFVGQSKSIKLLEFLADFEADLKKYLPPSASVENPIDVIGDAPPERYQKMLEKISEKYPDSPTIVILTPQNQTDPENVAKILAKVKNKIPNLSACFMGGEKIARASELLGEKKVANFENPERVLAIIEKLAKYEKERNKKKITDYFGVSPKIDSAVQKVFSGNRKMFFWDETEKLFRKYRVKMIKSVGLKNLSELKNKRLSFPLVLKADDPNIAHRLEKDAVALNIQNKKELQTTFSKMKSATGAKHFLVQPMAAPGLELIIGMKRDPVFGPVMLCGWGGSLTEIFQDKVILIPPLDQKNITEKLSQLAIFPILKGFRGKKGFNLNEVSKIILAVSQIATRHPEISEIDINPLLLYNNGQGGQILDAKVFLS